MRSKIYLICLPVLMGLVAACVPKTSTNDADTSGFSFVFMTDIHVEDGRSAPAGLMMALDTINKLGPDFVLTGGDLISDALNATESRADSLYRLYISIMKNLEMPVHNTVGNHENLGWEGKGRVAAENPLFGQGMYRKYLGDPYYTFEYKGWKFFVLCSPQQTKTGYTGAIDSTQFEWIRSELASTDTAMPLVISVHIPLISVYQQMQEGSLAANPEGLVTRNGKEVIDLFSRHNLRLVLQGHLHYLEEIKANNIQFITGGAVCSAWWTGRYHGLEEGFLHLTIKGDDISWKYIDYGWTAKP
ncbi:MAG: metallophosphoesterase [Bacteroidales bacterium]